MKETLAHKLKDILARYSLMLVASLGSLWIFYFIFSPLTIYPVYFILNALFGATLYQNIILVAHQFPIELIDACIAGSAYYLLFILNLSTYLAASKAIL